MITRFHTETTEPEVTQLLREMINEVGMDFGSARIECTAKPITHAFIHFMNNGDKQVHQVSEHVEKRTERKKS